ncbi:MAG: hypothetical protein EA422_02155 [Gemmatimonadales bacterium]|nr:MAG: hypothetical protein EA422_02155 [Gemmatimonadales bacterium]
MNGVSRFRVPVASAALAALPLLLTGCGEAEEEIQAAMGLEIHEVTDVGFQNPSAILMDLEEDVYLVANTNGEPTQENRSGFISRVSPEGEVLDLEWIELSATARPLNAPRGMALRGDSLFVADIDCIRIFHRTTGEDLGATCLDGVSFIADIAVGEEGSLFVTDAGLTWGDGRMQPTGTDAVYRVVMEEGRRGSTLAQGDDLGHPTGIAVGPRGIFVTAPGTGELFALSPDGSRTDILRASDRELSGLTFLTDGSFVFSSLAEESVTMVDAGGQVMELAVGIPDAQGLGYDAARHRLLVAIPSENRLLFMDLP